jgi:hypothetical protein
MLPHAISYRGSLFSASHVLNRGRTVFCTDRPVRMAGDVDIRSLMPARSARALNVWIELQAKAASRYGLETR